MKKIEDPLDYNMLPLDIPYINLFFHKNCFKLMGGYDNMRVYCTENLKRVYNWSIDRNKERKNK
jgi:hypothetical protein